ncbi:MAG: pyruvate kinase [Ectothiorhodospiraceae bacterium]|nr:pyruvate kinase [Chromatiales bacterium]MCP5153825.1 pyruvate kinase [Ectothiorhodospiraceae bacterium]
MPIDLDTSPLRNRRTRIVATLGPASDDETSIAALVEAGVDVFRLNMSHGDHASHGATLARIREAAARADRVVGVLADLAGPKIRVGRFRDGGIELVEGEAVRVTTRDVEGEPGLIPSQYPELARDVRSGDRMLLADGAMELVVLDSDGVEARCEVRRGGFLTDRKGINLPGVDVSAPSLGPKDRADARFMLERGIDYLGLSFVRSAADVVSLRALVAECASHAGIIAKVERAEALHHADAVVSESDAVMVARGDLGVELPAERVPTIQHQLIDLARRHNRPVIVATQMLESMIESERPTRAEVSDVAHAVMAGADAVMLSGETASGEHPVEAARTMDRIAREAERYLWSTGAFGRLERLRGEPPIPFGDAVARSMAQLSRDLKVRAVVAVSRSGMSAVTLSAARPAAPLVAVSPDIAACRRMALMWGVIPIPCEEEALGDPVTLARRLVHERGLATPGEFFLLVRGFHADPYRNAPTITLLTAY